MKDINDKHDKTIDMQLYPFKFKKKKILEKSLKKQGFSNNEKVYYLTKRFIIKRKGFYLTERFLSNGKVFSIENRLKKNKELKSE